MEKIKAFFKKIGLRFASLYVRLTSFGADKYMHFIAGVLITLVFALPKVLAPYAWIVGIAAGATKEFIDSRCGGQPEAYDFLATSLGALATQICLWAYLIIW